MRRCSLLSLDDGFSFQTRLLDDRAVRFAPRESTPLRCYWIVDNLADVLVSQRHAIARHQVTIIPQSGFLGLKPCVRGYNFDLILARFRLICRLGTRVGCELAFFKRGRGPAQGRRRIEFEPFVSHLEVVIFDADVFLRAVLQPVGQRRLAEGVSAVDFRMHVGEWLPVFDHRVRW